MKKIFAITFACIAWYADAMAQQKCGSAEVLASKFAGDPVKEAAFREFKAQKEQEIAAYEQQMANTAQKTTATVTLPVVFHFVLDSNQFKDIKGMEGITRRVANQLLILNTDFNGMNTDTNKVPAVFKPLIGNLNINFSIARVNQQGKSTSGIEVKVQKATSTPLTFTTSSGNEKYTSKGGLDAWDPQRYMNIWVVNIVDGVLGYAISAENAAYAQLPQEGGVVLDYAVFGRATNADTYFIGGADLGRTGVHEVGHYLNLNHIWGEKDDCSDDDGVDDTPKQDKATTSCPQTFPVANCTGSAGGKMYMNYMDYVNDACMHMFTKKQVVRMQAQLAPGGAVHSLTQNPQLTWWPANVAAIDMADAVSVYPNPAGSVFSLNFAQPTQGVVFIELISITGQIAKRMEVPVQTTVYAVDAAGLNKGLYIVQCRFEEGTVVTRKIALQ